MGIQVIDSYPKTRRAARLGRAVLTALGMLLLGVGLVAAALDVLSGVVLASDVGMDAESLAWLGVLTVIMLLGLWTGTLAIRGRRRIGLYLRRFGYRDSTRTMSLVVARVSGRQWRLVTLDDANLAPVGIARRPHRVVATAMILGLVAAAYGIYATVGSVLLADRGVGGAALNLWAAVWPDLLGEVASLIVALVLVGLILVLAGCALVTGVAGGSVSKATSAARERAAMVVSRGVDVDTAAAGIRRDNRRIFGSRHVVCRAVAVLWQDAVVGLAAESDTVVIDVSRTTDNVIWEVETMRNSDSRRWVLVCHRDRVARLLHLPVGANAPAGPQADDDAPADIRLARLLDGCQVLLYGDSLEEQRSFVRSLRHRLEAATAR